MTACTSRHAGERGERSRIESSPHRRSGGNRAGARTHDWPAGGTPGPPSGEGRARPAEGEKRGGEGKPRREGGPRPPMKCDASAASSAICFLSPTFAPARLFPAAVEPCGTVWQAAPAVQPPHPSSVKHGGGAAPPRSRARAQSRQREASAAPQQVAPPAVEEGCPFLRPVAPFPDPRNSSAPYF